MLPAHQRLAPGYTPGANHLGLKVNDQLLVVNGVAQFLFHCHPRQHGGLHVGVEKLQAVSTNCLGRGFLQAGVQAFQQHHKLVTAQSCHGVPYAHAGGEPLRHLLLQQVALVMPQAVVQFFEVAQVNEQHGTTICVAQRKHFGLFEPVHQQRSVGQVGEGVEKGQLNDFFFGLAPCGDITNIALDDTASFAVV